MSLVAIACSAPLEFDDWAVPVPEGTRIVEYAHVPNDERTGRLEIVEDLVIGGDADDPNQSFYRVEDVAVDANGNIYVLESGNKRVQVFDQRGRYLRTIGSEGQGPGELQEPHGIIVAGDAVVVPDLSNRRVNRWSLDGEYIGTSTMVRRTFAGLGLADGTILGGFIVYHREREIWEEGIYGRFSTEGAELQRFATFRLAHREIVMVPSTPAPVYGRSAARSARRVCSRRVVAGRAAVVVGVDSPRWLGGGSRRIRLRDGRRPGQRRRGSQAVPVGVAFLGSLCRQYCARNCARGEPTPANVRQRLALIV